MDFEQIKPALKSYLKKLSLRVGIAQAIVFGSIAEGKATADSDIDLLIISPDFARFDQEEREKLLYRTSVGLPFDLHVYGFTLKEFDAASTLTALGLLKKQKVIRLQ